jgi:ABC-2 type transport system permease protein
MGHAIRAEWIKFRSVRANAILITIAVLAPVALSILVASLVRFDRANTAREVYGAVVIAPAVLASYLCGVLGVLGIGQEYRHSTIRVTFAAQPRRSVVLGAKAAVYGAFGLFIGVLAPALALVAGGIISSARHHPLHVEPASWAGVAVLCTLLTWFGFGLGSIMRQPAGAIPVFLIWPLVVEGILSAIFESVNRRLERWLPFRAGQRLAAFGSDQGVVSFGRVGSGLYFAAWTVAVVAIGWWLVQRRDA